MPNSIISSFLAPSALTIKDSKSGQQQAKNLKISKVSIRLTSAVMRHMKEDGSTVIDSRIIHPSAVTIDAFCPDSATAKQINNLLMDRDNFYSLSSKGVMVENVMAESEQLRQDPDVMSAVPIKISFKQVMSKNTKPVIVAQQSDSSIVDRGMVILNSAKASALSIYEKMSGLI